MIECAFTVDYEIYGNGIGSLRDLVYEPARALKAIFDQAEVKFVVFVEAVELQKIEQARVDSAIASVKCQVKEFYDAGFEIALHLHPQWSQARYQSGTWLLNENEYNLCPLKYERITEIVEQAIGYLREILDAPGFTPFSFRAGNWLFQPTKTAARVLAEHGLRLDSSVFKGGRQRKHKLDYRRATHHGYYWMFRDDVIVPDPEGDLLEIPIYTMIVPFWKMVTLKRLGLQNKATTTATQTLRNRLDRLLDLLRFRQPLKFDFCRMTLNELTAMMNKVIREDRRSPETFKPIVAIGHTKDLTDLKTVKAFLRYLRQEQIAVSTLEAIYSRCFSGVGDASTLAQSGR